MSSAPYDVTLIGGGIVGLATAHALVSAGRRSVAVLEAEDRLAAHQTGHNSGVIHSGLYYKPGSLKARNCIDGRDEMYRFCSEHGVPHENCGKLVVATSRDETARLDALEQRGHENGLKGLRRLAGEELKEREPHAAAIDGLWVPQTGIVDFTRVAEVLADRIRQAGAVVRTAARVVAVHRRSDRLALETSAGDVETRHLINCAGLQSDRVARLCGLRPGLRIVPFRGEYYKLMTGREHLIRNLLYPVPDPRFPFLGVHFTRMIGGGVEAGPNAVLALKREGYSRWSFSPADALGIVGYRGFWRLASTYWKTGCGEFHRSFSKKAFVQALRRLVPDLQPADLERHSAGVRAQAVGADGGLLDDFHIQEDERMLHVLNAPSPAATASLSIGRTLARRADALFGPAA